MIYIRLAGGLGNQLFQLATGLEMQYRTNQAIGIYTGDLKRYAVKREAAALNLIQLSERMRICNKNFLPILALRGRLGRFGLPFCLNDRTIANPNITQKHYLLDGYFQNIELIKNGINSLLSNICNKPIDKKVKDVFANVTANCGLNDICALHIRRSDYVLTANKSIYPLLDAKYYSKGLEAIGGNIKKLIVFSDDRTVDFDFFKDFETVRIADSHLTDYQEIILMSMFQNFIIANSTFSFWGALLNFNNKKRLIAPALWTYVADKNAVWQKNLEYSGFELNRLKSAK